MNMMHGVFFAFVTAAASTVAQGAAATITVDEVVQRWPWNNKVDITYTVGGGQMRSAGVYCGLRFTLTAGGVNYDFEGYTVGASAENGTHTVTWTVPQGVAASDCTMTATLFTTNVPSGNDYMIVDLTSGEVVYEGLFASQEESNERYNTSVYKKDKMVLRKVPRTADSASLPNGPFTGGYPTGDNDHYSSGIHASTERTWVADRAWYVGVFLVTQYQYAKIGADAGNNPSIKGTGDEKPVESVSWNDLRRPTGSTDDFASTSSIPIVTAPGTGTFLQRLNFLTGNKFAFDLPTEVMSEIAERAGATTYFSWGDSSDPEVIKSYVICSENSKNTTVAVGTRLPNAWGLYDSAGNVWEWCRDYVVEGDLALRTGVFDPAWEEGGTLRRYHGGGHWGYAAASVNRFHASNRNNAGPDVRGHYIGFRVVSIAE